MFTILNYSTALEYSIIRRYTNIVYYYYIIISVILKVAVIQIVRVAVMVNIYINTMGIHEIIYIHILQQYHIYNSLLLMVILGPICYRIMDYFYL